MDARLSLEFLDRFVEGFARIVGVPKEFLMPPATPHDQDVTDQRPKVLSNDINTWTAENLLCRYFYVCRVTLDDTLDAATLNTNIATIWQLDQHARAFLGFSPSAYIESMTVGQDTCAAVKHAQAIGVSPELIRDLRERYAAKLKRAGLPPPAIREPNPETAWVWANNPAVTPKEPPVPTAPQPLSVTDRGSQVLDGNSQTWTPTDLLWRYFYVYLNALDATDVALRNHQYDNLRLLDKHARDFLGFSPETYIASRVGKQNPLLSDTRDAVIGAQTEGVDAALVNSLRARYATELKARGLPPAVIRTPTPAVAAPVNPPEPIPVMLTPYERLNNEAAALEFIERYVFGYRDLPPLFYQACTAQVLDDIEYLRKAPAGDRAHYFQVLGLSDVRLFRNTPTRPAISAATPTPTAEKETPMSETKTVKSTRNSLINTGKRNSTKAAAMLSGRQIAKLVRSPLVAFLAAKTGGNRRKIARWLGTTEGLAGVMGLLGLGLGFSPLAKHEDVPGLGFVPANKLALVAETMREDAMATLGDSLASVLTNPLYKGLGELLAMVTGMAEEALPNALGDGNDRTTTSAQTAKAAVSSR